MDEDLREELEALAVAYLTQHLKEFPSGVTLDYFTRTFPEKMDETNDWYKKNFKMPTVLAALEAIPTAVRLSFRGGQPFISLNKNSDKVDQHLVDLVSNQRASSKSKRRPGGGRSHSQRVVDSFTLNRRYSNHNYNTENRFKNRFSQSSRMPTAFNGSSGWDSQNRWGNQRTQQTASYDQHRSSRPTVYHERPARAAPGDPRAAQAPPPMVPPQVRPISSSTLSSATPSKKPPQPSPRPSSASTSMPTKSQAIPPSKPVHITPGEQVKMAQDPGLSEKKSKLRSNLIDLLTTKFDTLKIFHLASIYKEEYKEDLEPSTYGYKTITELLKDPFFKDCIKIIFDHPYNLIKAAIASDTFTGKENVSHRGGNESASSAPLNSNDPLSDLSNNVSAAKAKYNVIDPFNVRTMLQSLEPLKDIKTPPLGNLQVEDIVKYRTMRIIYKSPDMTLKLDDWELKYQIEWNSRIRIPIQDYGFKTLLEFFKHLSNDIPIKIRLANEEFVAKSDYDSVSKWLNESLAIGKYRAIMVMDKKYDYIAYPNDTYPDFDLKSLTRQDYYPVTIMSVKKPHKMWLQFKTKESIVAHLAIETSLTSYEDYKKKETFPVPLQFIKVGFPCVAFDDSQQRWCRASVAEVPEKINDDSNITVFLVDYGVARNFKRSQLQCILKTHLSQPVGLIYAQLHGVSEDTRIEQLAKITLQEYTNPPVLLACKILSSVHTPLDDVDIRWQSRKSIFNVTLIDTRQGRDCNLATAINTCTSTPEDVD